MKFKYKYTGTGIMTFWDKKKERHTVSLDHPEVILNEKIEVAGIELVEEIKETKGSKKPGGK